MTSRMLIASTNRQVAGFVILTMAWLLSTTAMGLSGWRLWFMDKSMLLPSGLAHVGMWKVCIYRHSHKYKETVCYSYTYRDTYIPVDIRIAQNLLLAASILGLLGKVLIIFALRNIYMGIRHMNDACKPFLAAGILNVTASICIFIAVSWNYHSVRNGVGIAFPPSFYLPFKPTNQETGSASLMAGLGAFAMLLSGLICFSYKSPSTSQVHPDAPEI